MKLAKMAAVLWALLITNYLYSGFFVDNGVSLTRAMGGVGLTIDKLMAETFVLCWWALEDFDPEKERPSKFGSWVRNLRTRIFHDAR